MNIWTLSVIVGFAAAATSRAEPNGIVEGLVMIGPINAGSLDRATFTARKEERTVASFNTDEHGHFRVSLPAGMYTVELKDRKEGIGQCGPFAVEIRADETTSVEWRCDNSTAVRLPPTDR